VLGDDISIGAGTILYSHVAIADHVTIGQDNHLYPTCVIGCCPQVLGMTAETSLGRVVIGDRNMIRENVTIHPSRSPGGITRIGSDVLMMVGSHIGHDCIVGDQVVLSNYVQVAGHVEIGTGAWFAGMAGSHQFVTIGRWSFITGLAGITRDVPPFLIVSGHYPARIRGVNKRGLLRAGLNQQQQEDIYAAYKTLYRRGSSLLANAKALSEQDGIDENVRDLIDFIFKSHQHRFGRYRESLRTH
jgi:UDP-N-acetylglucosamine acyltransferase